MKKLTTIILFTIFAFLTYFNVDQYMQYTKNHSSDTGGVSTENLLVASASMTPSTDGADATISPVTPPPKPQWYWVGQEDHAKEYKWRLQYYANVYMDSATKHIMSDLNDMRIGIQTYGDYGGHIADATAPLDFANGEVTRRKVDTLLELLRHQCTWTFDDSLQAAIKLIRDYPKLGESPEKKKTKKKKK